MKYVVGYSLLAGNWIYVFYGFLHLCHAAVDRLD